MKANLAKCVALLTALSAVGHAQTINWGSEVLSDLRDSRGVVLDATTFKFELGAFNAGFDPASNSLASWFLNWHVFDTATSNYNKGAGYFSSPAQMQDNGSTDPAVGAFDFQTLPAYLWIRNATGMTMNGGSEWLLVHDSSWTFPKATPGCCDNALPIEWSVSDLGTNDVPLFGSQGVEVGLGTHTYDGSTTLQTYTLGASGADPAPEPSSSVMLLLLGAMALLDRRRVWICRH